MAARVRLYIETPLYGGRELDLDENRSHYLSNVMKLAAGDAFLGFDGRSGEFEMQIAAVSKKHCRVIVGEQLREFQPVPDIWLLFAPVKKDQTDFIIQKAVELGARRLQPVITRRTITDKVRRERFRVQGIEAAEQCRRLDVPEINEAQSLEKVLQNWDKSRRLFFMDETGHGLPVRRAFAAAAAPAAILVGPEGGFSAEELQRLRELEFAQGVTLGPRILRAETAVAAALSCWQSLSGDWADYSEDR